jgi:predicted enzyme related to lactoylglutathione lyase
MIENRKIVHIEIPSANTAQTQQFYASLCGWEFNNHDGEVEYSGSISSNVGLGFPKIDNEFTQAGIVVIYLESQDIDADLRAVENAGGTTIVPQTPVEGMGAFAIFKDPSGNPIGFWKDL